MKAVGGIKKILRKQPLIFLNKSLHKNKIFDLISTSVCAVVRSKLTAEVCTFFIKDFFLTHDISGYTWHNTAYVMFEHKFMLRSSTSSNCTSSEFTFVSRKLMQKAIS